MLRWFFKLPTSEAYFFWFGGLGAIGELSKGPGQEGVTLTIPDAHGWERILHGGGRLSRTSIGRHPKDTWIGEQRYLKNED